jgi:hypothetical protein
MLARNVDLGKGGRIEEDGNMDNGMCRILRMTVD